MLNFAFLYDQNNKKYTRNAWSAMEIDLHAIKKRCLLFIVNYFYADVARSYNQKANWPESKSGLLGEGKAGPGRSFKSKRYLDMISF